MDSTTKRGFLLAKGWIQAVLLVTLFGFFVLGFLAYKTYTGEPPIPGKVVNPDGQVLFTRANIMAGQGIFLQSGLMEYGSIFGHGAYLGPDFTADYLHRAAVEDYFVIHDCICVLISSRVKTLPSSAAWIPSSTAATSSSLSSAS